MSRATVWIPREDEFEDFLAFTGHDFDSHASMIERIDSVTREAASKKMTVHAISPSVATVREELSRKQLQNTSENRAIVIGELNKTCLLGLKIDAPVGGGNASLGWAVVGRSGKAIDSGTSDNFYQIWNTLLSYVEE